MVRNAWLQPNRVRLRILLGMLLGLGAPLGWLGIRIVSGESMWEELGDHTGLYLYMLATSMTAFGLFGAHLGRQESRLEQQSVTDGLTGLKNFPYFFARLEEAYAQYQRTSSPFALAVVDLDGFKSINDIHGHPVGDRALAVAASSIASIVRRGDTAARVGGDEFALLLPGRTSVEAHQIGERICEVVRHASAQSLHEHGSIGLTASVGIASTDQCAMAAPRDLYVAADNALYQAKRQGRDRAITKTSSPPPVSTTPSLSQRNSVSKAKSGS
jgi:diguanylate cyclase (GGDEF)-like protein